jgi:hypothetical protein
VNVLEHTATKYFDESLCAMLNPIPFDAPITTATFCIENIQKSMIDKPIAQTFLNLIQRLSLAVQKSSNHQLQNRPY